MSETTLMVIRIIVAVLALVITRYVIPLIKAKTDSSKYNEFVGFVSDLVCAAEQMIGGEKMGAERKKLVIEYATDRLVDLGLEINAQQLDMLVEAAVFGMNSGKE